MASHIQSDSSRKPSGSSSHSGIRSGTSSPGISASSQRKLTPTNASNMLGVAMTGSSGMKGLNAGWEVWGSNSSRRNASVSSATSVTEVPQGEGGYRAGMGESWTVARSSSATWEESNVSPQRKDFSSLDSLNLHQARQRQTNGDRSAGSKSGQFAQYDGALSKETNPQRFVSSGNIPNATAVGYEPSQQHPLNSSDSDLSMAFRGMAVEDDLQNQQQGGPAQTSTSPSNAQMRGPPVPHLRPTYGSYPQPTADFGYYANPALPRESYGEYPLGFDMYRNPLDPSAFLSPVAGGSSASTMYPSQSVHPDHRQASAVYYDFPGAPRPTSQFYYAPPAVVYPPSSPMNAQAPVNAAPSKKQDRYVAHQPHLQPQGMMYNAHKSPSPVLPTYNALMDYGGQVPLVAPGAPVYLPQAMQYFASGQMRAARFGETPQVLGLRSARLEDFRANRSRKWELKDIYGYAVEFSGDQHGSRFIQQKLETASVEEKQRIFDEIVPGHIIGLVSDVFGNYVIQKLLEHGTAAQRTVLVTAMEGHILTLSLHMYGCRVVQRAIEYITPDQQSSIVKEIEPHVLRCVKDANGNHVIQKIIERVAPERLAFVETFRGAVFELSTHAYGCRVLQRCLEHLPPALSHPIIEELHKYIINLMQDQFGNYVIQFVLEHGQPQDRALVTSKLRGQLLTMSRHKFASNVVEKALVCASPENRRALIDEILTVKADGSNPVVIMMKDQFGNYVLQRAMTVAEGEQKDELFNAVKPQLTSMRRVSNAYNKHLLAIERLLEKYHAPVSEPVHPPPS
ncbi:hypothetical protein ONZ45_g18055 [Pleurotus djamor]|nr:hypothetical protein ONZ45_g18055 [Pleurotus djamor]